MKKKLKWADFERLFGRKDLRPDDTLAICEDELSVVGADDEGPTFSDYEDLDDEVESVE